IYVKNFFKLMIPTLIGIFGYQINEIVDTNFASSLKIGTISAINYASRLYLLPVGIFAISLSVVIFPQLSIAVVKKNTNPK
ncbi:lipid II flippase MurJ, partial [Caviibacter abscessus]|uniref:lipid II flippase MurJ n=1 Tax=Caviibacter abscessus TaxID=1766719 RepID=UPI000AA318CD